MNEQYSGERFYTSAIVERTEKDTNGPVANSDPLTDKVPVEAALSTRRRWAGPLLPLARWTRRLSTRRQRPRRPIRGPGGRTGCRRVRGEHVDAPTWPPMGETITHEAPIGVSAGSSAALLSREESEHFRTRWNEIQGTFVDEPRSAVQQADALVSEVVEQITQMFANERSSLESQWKQGNDVSTEDLRKALQRYRSFFNRLVV